MASIEQIRERLALVQDPEIHRSIVELGMLGDVSFVHGTVRIEIKLTVAGCPLTERLQKDCEQVLEVFPEVKTIDVQFLAMSDAEKEALTQKLQRGQGGSQQGSVSAFVTKHPKTRILIIGSGKGGVGKSTVTVNLALALAQKGHKVGVLDADIYGFSVPRLLGIEQRPTVLNETTILPMERYGLKMMSMGGFVDEDEAVMWRGPMLGKVLEQFLNDVFWGELDYFLVDAPPGTGDMAISLHHNLPDSRLVLVTTPQQAAARVANRLAQMAKKTGQKILGVVENMSYYVCPHCGQSESLFGVGAADELAVELDAPVLAKIPLEPTASIDGDHGRPILVKDENAAASVEFFKLAERIEGLSW